jgi:large subunit ribosomal protein L21
MYAVVSTGGKQYRVAKDDVITVEKLNAQVGDTVTLDVLLVADGDEVTFGADAAAAVVTAEVVDHVRGEKLTVFKFKKRKGYKRTLGHRQELTRVRVADVALPGSKAKPAKKAAKPAPKAEAAKREPKAIADVADVETPAVAVPAEEKPKRTRTTKPKAEAPPTEATAEAPKDADAAEAKPKRTRAKKTETDESAE